MSASVENYNIWDNILGSVRKRLNGQIFDTWFSPIEFDHCDEENEVVHLKASQINKDWIDNNYLDLLGSTMSDLDLGNYRLTWKVKESDRRDDKFSQDITESVDPVESAITSTSNLSATKFVDIEPVESTLNGKYTFEKFVVGSCNEFAHAAAEAIVESPGNTYNPMFIYGGVGLGKTHLMHATGHAIIARNRHLRVAYITSEKFMNELINAIRFDKTQTFREKYRSIDVLLMDDVQFLAGKERTQEEFFHTFNALHNDQKQIIITSDCPPREIPTIEERLHSRFEWGLIADMEPPDLETKVAILKRKADLERIDLPTEIAFFIANKVKSNVRELEGTLVRLIAISSLRGLPISKMLAQDAMKNIIDAETAEGITIERVTKMVANHYDLALEEIKSKNNSRHIALPRQAAMYLCKRLTQHSFPEIGRAFGGKHHTTVMHSVDKIEKLIKADREFHKVISEFIDDLCN